MDKPVLDATCGSRMIWFNKNNELAVFVDKREFDCEAIWTSGDGNYKAISDDSYGKKVEDWCPLKPP